MAASVEQLNERISVQEEAIAKIKGCTPMAAVISAALTIATIVVGICADIVEAEATK
jgi:hypothetical protein